MLFIGHAPALWLIYREPLPRPLRWPNLIAAAATLASMGLTYALAPPPWDLLGALIAWVAGHSMWGLYLAARDDPHRRP